MTITPVEQFDKVYLNRAGRVPTDVVKAKVSEWRQRPDHCDLFPRVRQKVATHVAGLWNEDDIPQTGWQHMGTRDLAQETEVGDGNTSTCEMCLWEMPRRLHILRHPETGLMLEVGCECALDLVDRLETVKVRQAHRELDNSSRRYDRLVKGFRTHEGWRRVLWIGSGTRLESFRLDKEGLNERMLVLVPKASGFMVVARTRVEGWTMPVGEWAPLDGRVLPTVELAKERVLRDLMDRGLRDEI